VDAMQAIAKYYGTCVKQNLAKLGRFEIFYLCKMSGGTAKVRRTVLIPAQVGEIIVYGT